MSLMIYPLIFAMSLVVSFLLTPMIRYIGLKFDIIDKKDGRKIHRKVITKLGGVAIFLSFVFATLSAFLLEYVTMKPHIGFYGVVLIGAGIIFCLGIYDDVWGAAVPVKIVTQILAALVLVKYGIVIERISTPFGVIEFFQWATPATVLFLVAITNSMNLIDGMDGLAAGTIVIISLGLFGLILATDGSMLVAYLAVALAGANLGFLRYNFYPAKIFMGDTGSLFLGFTLGAMAIISSVEHGSNPHPMGFLAPFLILGFPILDTSFVFLRRIVRKCHPFKADNSHFHHLLLKKGFSQKQTAFILYSVSLFFIAIASLVL